MSDPLLIQPKTPWTVQITVIKCSALPKMDGPFGKCDAYVKIRTAGVATQTATIKKVCRVGTCSARTHATQEYNPIFNHPFPPAQIMGLTDPLLIEVWDWDKTGKHDLISALALSPGELLRLASALGYQAQALMPHFQQELNIPLKTKKRGGGSSITLGVALTWPMELQPLTPQQRDQWLFAVSRGRVIKTLEQWKINKRFFDDLCSLNRFDIVLVLDDSGSMSSSAGKTTRWEELKEVAHIAS